MLCRRRLAVVSCNYITPQCIPAARYEDISTIAQVIIKISHQSVLSTLVNIGETNKKKHFLFFLEKFFKNVSSFVSNSTGFLIS
jgi:hypothetical protein